MKQVEQPAFGPGSIDVAMANQRGKLRIQLGERELMRNRILLLEQQSVAAELHDDTTGEHCYRVGRLASILGKEIGLEEDVCFLIDLAARLHDIGKLVVPDAILLKPGKLTPGEREIMQTHTTAGADILAKSNIPQMHIAEEIARHHHERWDGNGYPTKLARHGDSDRGARQCARRRVRCADAQAAVQGSLEGFGCAGRDRVTEGQAVRSGAD